MYIGISGSVLLESVKDFLGGAFTPDSPKGMAGGAMVGVLARGLLERGYRVVIFTQEIGLNEEKIVQGPSQEQPQLKVCVVPCRPRPRQKILDIHRLERGYLRRAIERERPDIVHAHWTYEYAVAALDSGIPTLVTPRDWAPYIFRVMKGLKSRIGNLEKMWLNLMTLKRARYLSVCSPYMKALLERRCRASVRLIPNCVRDDLLRLDEKPGPVAASASGSAALQLLSVNAYFDRRKNVRTLLRAFPLIRARFASCGLTLAGIQHEPGGLAEQWARSEGLAGGVRFAGPLPHAEIFQLLDRSDALVHPALEESFGNTLIEAMARRTPVVGGRRSGAVPWVLGDGSAGLLCDVTDPAQIAEACIRLLGDPALWKHLSQAGYERVKECFTLSKVLDQYLEEYERILQSERGRK
ncbi:MAG: glycosyltransferase family 4 protein [Candidatus Sumerlaeota bacterium]|nr:glycosyltransferase family 4 protein [Candidatus Sumerlaeota bacterium]